MRITTIACAVKIHYRVPVLPEMPILIGNTRAFVQGRAAGSGFSNRVHYDVSMPKFVRSAATQAFGRLDREFKEATIDLTDYQHAWLEVSPK
ncbi:hypothetical protein VVP001_095 [Vibrio phage VVP001]|uniref:Uncharacterized protein n=1 Tax=Vibrio phage VVP001 TaxID=2059877 RepID=A0A3Q8D167_9CAUD|nr:hypothetical protein VVP001_095 [Vibrio phage VVP001]